MKTHPWVTTGIDGLDAILDGLRVGDNVVWKVRSVADYQYFVRAFVAAAGRAGRGVVYFRFGQHDALLDVRPGVSIHELDPAQGFEPFTSSIHSVIAGAGRGAFYVFDSLSDLLTAWATDHMIGNFFQVTCPFLFEMETVAYFALLRERHAFRTIARIRETTQVLLDVLNCDDQLYLHPLKVWDRHSPTLFLPHRREGTAFVPLANSYDATNLMDGLARQATTSDNRQLDYWQRLFLQAETLAATPKAVAERKLMVGHLSRHVIGRDERIIALAGEWLSLRDLLNVKSRMIGTGFLGGKVVGMLLARNILLQDPEFEWSDRMESHDSFYVGSDVYYSYIVHNGWWKLYMRQKTDEGYFEAATELREKMLSGSFPEVIRDGFQQMLEYYGQYPIIVRSSSLLEDGFGSAFTGKYDSFFCANQGSPEVRQAAFEDAVRKIFASTMSTDALTYRRQRGLDRREEQMALLIQRVSGAYRGHYYFPDLAGVGVSHNTFVWDPDMDPKAGMLRLVLGLGTRAVDRVDGDYPCIIALDAPMKRPHRDSEDARRFSQREVDLVDVSKNTLETVSLLSLVNENLNLALERYATRDYETMHRLEELGRKGQQVWVLNFEALLTQSSFTADMGRLLKTLEAAYQYPVDIEFTVNFTADGAAKINVLQCRPLQTKGQRERVRLPERLADEQVFFRSEGHFMGGSHLPGAALVDLDRTEGLCPVAAGRKVRSGSFGGPAQPHDCRPQERPDAAPGARTLGHLDPLSGGSHLVFRDRQHHSPRRGGVRQRRPDAGTVVRLPFLPGPGGDRHLLRGPVPRHPALLCESPLVGRATQPAARGPARRQPVRGGGPRSRCTRREPGAGGGCPLPTRAVLSERLTPASPPSADAPHQGNRP